MGKSNFAVRNPAGGHSWVGAIVTGRGHKRASWGLVTLYF